MAFIISTVLYINSVLTYAQTRTPADTHSAQEPTLGPCGPGGPSGPGKPMIPGGP